MAIGLPFAVAIAAASPSVAGEALHVAALPAWDGLFAAGQPTEMRLRVSSPRAEDLVIRVTGTALPTTLTLTTRAGAHETFALPLLPTPNGDLAVFVETARTEPRARLDVALRPLGTRPLVAVATRSSAVVVDESRFHVAYVAAADLPQTLEGYGVPHVVVVDGRSLAELSPRQVQALAGHLAMCGRTLAIGLPAIAVERLAAAAGCHAAAVRFVADGADAAAAIDALLAVQVPPLPTSRRVAADLGASTPAAAAPLLLGIVGSYLVGAGVLACITRRPFVLLLWPFLATGVVIAAASVASPQSQLYIDAEVAWRSAVGRYAGLLRIDGWRLGEAALPLPESAMVRAATPRTRLTMAAGSSGELQRTLITTTTLASRTDIPLAGWFAETAARSGAVVREDAALPEAIHRAFAPLPVTGRLRHTGSG
jgi:hypothetical protein